VIRKIAVDPSTSDGVPRLAVDVVLASDTQPYGAKGAPARAVEDARPPPTKLPPACGHPLPSVLVSPGLVRDLHKAEERPPRRRVHSTAEISRRPGSDWAWSAPPVVISRPRVSPRRRRAAQRLTARVGALGAGLRGLRAWLKRSSFGVLLMLVPAVLVVAALLAI
jgi:hypothetical protein